MPLTSYVKSPPVHHVVRWIAAISDPQAGHSTIEEADSYISTWTLKNYKVLNTHYLGTKKNTESGKEAYGVMYILVLEQTALEKLRVESREEKAEKGA